MTKKERVTKDIYIKGCPVALHNAFMARCKLHGRTFKDVILALMRKHVKEGTHEQPG